MKTEADSCISECQRVINVLEEKVQMSMLKDIVGSDDLSTGAAANISRQHKASSFVETTQPEIVQSHLESNKLRLNSMTVSSFEQKFIKEMTKAATSADVLSLRDL
jgi:hypothetical protein